MPFYLVVMEDATKDPAATASPPFWAHFGLITQVTGYSGTGQEYSLAFLDNGLFVAQPCHIDTRRPKLTQITEKEVARRGTPAPRLPR